MTHHRGTCPCDDCVTNRDRIRTASMARGQRVGWNAHSLDDPRERNALTFRGKLSAHLHEQETPHACGARWGK